MWNFSPTIAGHGKRLILCSLVFSAPLAVQAQDEIEKIFWESVECGEEAQVRAYLETYPGGFYMDEAVNCLKADNTEEKQQRLSELLAACDAHVKANRLTTGAAGNALECYRQVLDEDPDNTEAMNGLQAIEATYARWARSAIEGEDTARARANFEKLRSLNPEHPALAGIEDGIETLEASARALVRQEEERARDREYWQGVSCDSKSGLESYKRSFPDGQYVKQADNCLAAIEQRKLAQTRREEQTARDRNLWQSVRCSNKSELESYKRSFPDGQYVKQANDCLAAIEQQAVAVARRAEQNARDREFWQSISCENESQLISYKQAFPDGMYLGRANTCLAGIKQARQRAKSVYGFWSGRGSDFLVPNYQVSLDIKKNDLTIHADYPGGTSCEGKLVADEPVERLSVGQSMSFEAKLLDGPCFKKAKVKIEWTSSNRMEYSWYKLGIKMGGGELARR